MTAIYLKEVKSYFRSLTGWLYSAFILIFAGIYTMVYNLAYGYSQFEYVLESMAFVFLIACPILTMRTFAEEKHSKTDQLLYSLPLNMSSVATAKFLAILTVNLVPCVIMCAYPVLLGTFGTINLKAAYSSLIMFYLLGASLNSIGMFISSITENQVASAVITIVVMLLIYFGSALSGFVSDTAFGSLAALCALALIISCVLYIFTRNGFVAGISLIVLAGGLLIAYAISSASFEGLFPDIMDKLSLFERFYTVVEGVFDLTAIVYYVTISGVFLFLTTQSLEKRRWG